MAIEQILEIEAPIENFPVVNQLQGLIKVILSDGEVSTTEALIDALATAVVGLETRVVELEALMSNHHVEALNTYTHVLNLERRLLESGVKVNPELL